MNNIAHKVILFIFFFCVSTQFVYAESPAGELTELLSNLNTLQADFSQTISEKKATSIQKSEGHFVLQRPGKFRWEVTRPIAQVIVANGQRLWIYDPDLQQVTIRVLNQEIGETPALLLSHPSLALTRDFKVDKISTRHSHEQWFLLTPKTSNSLLQSIRLGFQNQHIRYMQLEDHLGHTTVIEFQHVIENLSLSPKLFIFNLPSSQVDVIDETRGPIK